MPTLTVTRTVEVPVGPSRAFDLFTSKIDDWYLRGPHSWADPARAVAIRFEPGFGGRLVEVWDAATGEGFDLGAITAWEPGVRLAMRYRFPGLPGPATALEVRFEATAAGTLVTLTHTVEGFTAGEAATFGSRAWRATLRAFAAYVEAGPDGFL